MRKGEPVAFTLMFFLGGEVSSITEHRGLPPAEDSGVGWVIGAVYVRGELEDGEGIWISGAAGDLLCVSNVGLRVCEE